MKKVLCVMVLVCVIMGAAFAQQKQTVKDAPAAKSEPAKSEPEEAPKERKNAIALDTFQLFKGFIASNYDGDFDFTVFILSLAYERLLIPHVSIGGDIDMYFMDFDGTPGFFFSMAGEGRYYPVSTGFDKFFLGTTLGFDVLSIDGSAHVEDGGFVGLTASLKAGYKLVIAKMFYLEPSMGYVLSKSSGGGLAALFGAPSAPTPNGWNGGLRFGFMF